MYHDIDLAFDLAQVRPNGERAVNVRERLSVHIRAMAPSAQAYAEAMPCGTRARDVVLSTVHQATELARHPGGDQKAMLMLLATSATFLWRYGAGQAASADAQASSATVEREDPS
ncbi:MULTISPECIES: DUF6415 family natural product biosynthesis protein [Streptomyces]|uniref:DUF6415 family natural product biosynthesis protein n=1 Tax=Streptomyces noboritoensis TaxID=67337 RepID=A0ABV6TCG2_9ACTN|nr:DUF6415 family natural product biosynthesis protein [Streptomyces melanogenes]